MKAIITFLIVLVNFSAFAQHTNYNLKKGYAAEGYDVTSYFENNPIAGDKKFSTTYDGVKFKFVSQSNLDTFNANPEKFAPQYGGYCAYAVAVKGEKIGIDPKTFEIRDGKLYLFYNSWGVNTLEKWKEEGANTLQGQADAAWTDIKDKS
ncbi:MAG: YHS domain-containing protein [Flavobacteriales bacterium]|jgi:YHS domain-containing protein